MTPLVTLLVLGLLLVVALALLVWALVSAMGGTARARRVAARAERRAVRDARAAASPTRDVDPAPDAPRSPRRSNDELRGAKATRPERQGAPDDAFERFLRAGRDDDR